MKNNISTFVGTLTTDRCTFLVNEGETFLLTHLESHGSMIPVVMSQYFLEEYAGQRVKCLAFPRKTRKKIQGVRKVFAYLFCVHVEATDEPQDSRYVEIDGTVISCQELTLADACISRLQFEMECQVSFNNRPVRVVVPCKAFEAVARRLVSLKEGDYLAVKGYVSSNYNTLKVVVQEFSKEVSVDAVES